MELIKYPDAVDWKKIFTRPKMEKNTLRATIKSIFADVDEQGDHALRKFTSKFDCVDIKNLTLTKSDLEKLAQNTPKELVSAMDVAYRNIYQFHASQKSSEEKIETTQGVFCWRKSVGIDTVGLYIPGGSAPLFSTLLMLAIPAQIAGCQKVVVCTPPKNDTFIIHPAIAHAALICGIEEIITVGGAQAIAAMSLGTETVEKCFKIFGPGNQYVTAAKEYAQEFHTAIDMPAGPSELMVVADGTAHLEFIAADLLSQAEHGPDSQVILISDKEEIIIAAQKAVKQQLEQLPRKEIAIEALSFSRFILAKPQEISKMINFYAPEHLILQVEDTSQLLEKIRNAGSIFIGHFTPESAGDYASGTNHTLPTDGYAHMYSGVSLDSFVKKITFQEITKDGLRKIGPVVSIMAQYEELEAHKNAVEIRLKSIN